MTIQVASRDELLVLGLVESGGYLDSSELVHDALIVFQEHERIRQFVEAVEDGERAIVDGDVEEWSPDVMKRIRAEAREMIRTGTPIDPHVLP
jgi:hypothetical protein